MTKSKNLLKMITLSMLVAIGVVISPILRVEGMCPMAHFINIVCSVFLGPWYSLLCATLIGMGGAIFFPVTDITEFLYFIGSVFAPMIAVQIADFYILKNNEEHKKVSIKNIFIWFVGFIIYRLLMNVDIAVGSTLIDVGLTILICIVADFLIKRGGKNARK